MHTVLLTGAAGKLGRQMTRHFLDVGYTVVATGRHPETLEKLAADIAQPAADRLVSIVCDLEREGGDTMVEKLAAIGCQPTAIVNNAVDLTNQALQPDGSASRAQWQKEFELAVIAPYELVCALVTQPGNRLVSVVNIASMYGIVPRNPELYEDPLRQSPIHYGVAKAAMIHLTKELAVRLAPRVRVNAVSFGGIEGRVDDAFKQRYARLCPMRRMLRDDEVAASVAFLLSDGASMVTGHNLVVDGGWTIW